jgi:hypothetical protein
MARFREDRPGPAGHQSEERSAAKR